MSSWQQQLVAKFKIQKQQRSKYFVIVPENLNGAFAQFIFLLFEWVSHVPLA